MATIPIGETCLAISESHGIREYRWDETRVYRVTVEGFPGHLTNNYIIIDDRVTIVDLAFDRKKAREDLEQGMEIIRSDFGQNVTLADIEGIVVTHGHSDHFGMLAYPRFKGKKLYVHEADSAMMRDFKAQGAAVRERLGEFTRKAGREFNMDNLFYFDKLEIPIEDYELIQVHDGDNIINSYQVFHVPGHSPGHICLKVGPLLFLGDHILSDTTPHQIPSSLREGCGVRLYLSSLKKVAGLGELYGLPGHEEDVPSIPRRVEELEAFHYQRLLDILELGKEPKNLCQLTDEYYRLRPETLKGRKVDELVREDQILALEEVMAHIDYLIEDIRMSIAGLKNAIIEYCAG